MIDIKEIRSHIKNGTEESRFTAWLTLYSSDEPEVNEEIKGILNGTDPILKILLARFLSHLNTEKAIHDLINLLEDENYVVHQAACKAFERNFFEQKNQKLFPLIYSRYGYVKEYAIETLAFSGYSLLVAPLLTFEKNAPNNFKIKILS